MTINGQHLLIAWCVLIAIAVFESNAVAGESDNLSLGADYTVAPNPRYKLTQDIGDSTQLTDGHYVRGHFWSSRESVGWLQSGPIRIELDLGNVKAIDSICFNTARSMNAEVSFPQRVDILISYDRKEYSAIGDAYQNKQHADGDYKVQKFCASNLLASGRYVLLVVQPRGNYTFLDEIEVLGGDRILAKKNNFANRIKHDEILLVLKANQLLRSRKKALYRLAVNMLSSPDSASPDIQNKIKSLSSKLMQMEVLKQGVLDALENELFALHRMILASNFKQPLLIWHKNPWASFNQIESPSRQALLKSGMDFNLMRRGSTSNAFILTNNSDAQQKLRLTVTYDSHADNAPKFEVREVVPVIAKNNRFVSDALQPLKNSVVTVKSGESKQIWLTATADSSTAGEYIGKINITPLHDHSHVSEIILRMKVWPVTFPEKQSLFANAWSYLSWRAIRKIPRQAVRDLLTHHVNVFETHPSQIPWPQFKSGRMVVDYIQYDKLLRHQEKAQMRLLFLDFNNKSYRSFSGKYVFMSKAWKLVFKKWIKDLVEHMRMRGLDYQDFSFYPVDEPEGKHEVGYLLDTARLIKEVDPRIQVFTTIGKPVNIVDLYQLGKVVDTFQMDMRFVSSIQKTALTKLNKEVWSYSGGDKKTEPSHYRAQAWKAFLDGVTGVGFWAYADTGSSGTAWNDFDGTRPDHSVIYEGHNSIISSKRWEAWREGIEDYELLKIARQKILPGDHLTEFNAIISSSANNLGVITQLESTRHYLLSVASK